MVLMLSYGSSLRLDRYRTQRPLAFLLGQSRIASHILVFAALVPRFAGNDFLAWAGGRLNVAPLPATFEVAVEFLYRHSFESSLLRIYVYYRGLSVFLRKPQFHLCARRGDQRCSRDT